MKILIFGAGSYGRRLCLWLKKNTDHEIIGFVDNNKNDEKYLGYRIFQPGQINDLKYDRIIVSNENEKQRNEIKEQLKIILGGVENVKFLLEERTLMEEVIERTSSYTEDDPRVRWLKEFSRYVNSNKMDGAVAECGVYKGDYSHFISLYFPDRKLYLFDAFTGFDERDLQKERQLSNQKFLKGIFNEPRYQFRDGATYRLLKLKIPHFENVIIKKGYFPETAVDIDDKFVFVNLDMDLYQPQLAGLNFFYDRMIFGGIILLHDYFHPSLPGVEKAVKDFQKINGRKPCFPIGDGCSIAIVKT